MKQKIKIISLKINIVVSIKLTLKPRSFFFFHGMNMQKKYLFHFLEKKELS